MKSLLIVGASGHGKVVAEAAKLSGEWGELLFLDDAFPEIERNSFGEVLGNLATAETLRSKVDSAIVAIGNAAIRNQVSNELKKMGYRLPTLVHPSAWVSPSAKVGSGTVILAKSAVSTEVLLGDGVIVNTGATVDHDCIVGNYVHICPGANVAGDVRIGDNAWVGIGASVIQGVSIGSNATIGAGSVIISNVGSNIKVAGNPARQIDE